MATGIFMAVVVLFIGKLDILAANVTSGDKGYVNIKNYCVEGARSYSETSGGAYAYTRLNGDRTYLRMMFFSDTASGSPRTDNAGNILWAYCVEFGVDVNSYLERSVTGVSGNSDWEKINATARKGIELATVYGFPASNLGVSPADAYAATQAIIWEFQTGIRPSLSDNTRKGVTYKGKSIEADRMINMLKTYPDGKNKAAVTAYNKLIEKIYSYEKLPSFAGKPIRLSYDMESGSYTAVITDTNSVLDRFSVKSENPSIKVSVSGNTMKITSAAYVEKAKISLTKSDASPVPQSLLMLYSASGQASVVGQSTIRKTGSLEVNSDITTIKGFVSVNKIDSETKKPLPGAEFGVYSVSDTEFADPVTTMTTGEDGKAVSEALGYGEYVVKEITAPKGYKLNETTEKFTIKSPKETVNLIFEDECVFHKISVYKQGEIFKGFEKSDDGLKPIYEYGYLSGCKVDIFAAEDIITADGTKRYAKDEKVDTLITDSQGPVFSKDLFEGQYYIRESEAPEGYKLLQEDTAVNLFDDADIILENERIKLALDFGKTFIDSQGNKTQVSKEQLSKVTFGVYTGEDIGEVPADSLVHVIKCDENGEFSMDVDLPFGYDFYIREISTADGYDLNDEIYPVTYGESIDGILTCTVNSGENIQNKMTEIKTEKPHLDTMEDNPHTPSTDDPYIKSINIYSIMATVSFFALAIIRKKL